MFGIYKILNKNNGKFYIGSSSNLPIRKRKHFETLKNRTHQNIFLQNSYNKNNGKNFVFQILEKYIFIDESLLLAKEQKWLNLYYDGQKLCYNINPIASKPPSSSNWSLKTRKKMSLFQKAKIVSSETRKKMSDAVKIRMKVNNHMKGVRKSEKTKEKLSIAAKERYKVSNHPWLGRHHTDQTKNKKSEITKKYFEENGHYWTNKKHSEITKRKMSISGKNVKIIKKIKQNSLCWNLFIDDERLPTDLSKDWVIAMTSEKAMKFVLKLGCPSKISFDHDLGGNDTSMVFLKWLANDYFTNEKYNKNLNSLNVPDYCVHSQNPVGSQNIASYMESWKKAYNTP